MTSPAELWEMLQRSAKSLELASLGIAEPITLHFDAQSARRAKAQGTSSNMAFTFRRPQRSSNPKATFPYARALLVGTMPYPRAKYPGDQLVASYAVVDRYGELRRRLEELAGILRAAHYRATVVIDDNALIDKALARRSGVGWVGKNTLIMAPKHGPYLLIGTIVTDCPLLGRSESTRRDCGRCERCVVACPTQALDGIGGLDARRCLAWLLQSPGAFPMRYRRASGIRIYGCDDCLSSCPVGKKVDGLDDMASPLTELIEILGLGDSELVERYRHLYIPARNPNHLRRNALLALGNLGVRNDVVYRCLCRYGGDPDPILAEQARWSLRELWGEHWGRSLELNGSSVANIEEP